MQLTALRYFHETAQTGSIRRAAERLHVAPSAVSRQILKLEHDFGAPLFERGSQGVRLTAAGELLARQTQRTFRELGRVRDAIDDLRGLRRGEVTVFVMEGLVADFLPELLAEFHDRYQNVSFNIRTAATDRIVEALVRDEADIGVTFNAPDRSDLVFVADYAEPLDCLVAPDHPLAAADSVRLRDMMRYPMALPEVSFGVRQMFDRAMRRKKLDPQVFITTNSLELTKTLTMTGRAIAFMPALTVRRELRTGHLKALRIQAREFQNSHSSVCVHRDRVLPFAARETVRVLADKLNALNEERDAGDFARKRVGDQAPRRPARAASSVADRATPRP